MVEHIVLFKMKPESTPEQEATLIRMLNDMKGKIPVVVELSAGKNFSERAQGFHVGLRVLLNRREDLDVYGPHPDHQPVKEYVKAHCESVLAVDYDC